MSQQQHEGQSAAPQTDAESLRQAHLDALEEIRTAKMSNPFSLTNILVTVGIALGAFLADEVYKAMQENQRAMMAEMQQMHDALLGQRFAITNLQSDVWRIKEEMGKTVKRDEFDIRFGAIAEKLDAVDPVLRSPHTRN